MFQNEPYTKSKLDIKSGHNVITKIKIHTKHIKVYLLWEFKIKSKFFKKRGATFLMTSHIS